MLFFDTNKAPVPHSVIWRRQRLATLFLQIWFIRQPAANGLSSIKKETRLFVNGAMLKH